MTGSRGAMRTAVFSVLSILWACAGGGPDLNGPEGPSLMAAFSGDWVLDRGLSEDFGRNMRESMRDASTMQPAGARGGRTGGGMTGGRAGGRGGGGMQGGGMRGGMGSGMDPEEVRQGAETLRSLSRVPEEITLTLHPDTVALTEVNGPVTILELGADEDNIVVGGSLFQGSAKWTKEGIEIKREFEVVGSVKDKFSLGNDGTLVVKREVVLFGRSIRGTLVYQRKGSV